MFCVLAWLEPTPDPISVWLLKMLISLLSRLVMEMANWSSAPIFKLYVVVMSLYLAYSFSTPCR